MKSIWFDERLKYTDEIGIITAFNNLMRYSIYSTAYAFSECEDKPYLMYQENGIWTLDYAINEEERSKKRFTNLYDLCKYLFIRLWLIDIAREFDNCPLIGIPCGTRVVVMKQYIWNAAKSIDVDDFIEIGTIIKGEYNSKYHVREYTIFMDDGKEIKATYKNKFGSMKSFKTMEGFLLEATVVANSNECKINGTEERTKTILEEAVEKVTESLNECLSRNGASK